MIQPAKSTRERLLHAVLYEACAMLILVPLGSWLLGHGPAQMGVLAIMLSTIAMSWNMLFGALFEHLERRLGWQRTVRVRTLHAVLFEGGLVVICVPLVAWWMGVSYWQALLLDIGILLFFLPYTYLFNWVYDHARLRLKTA
jgi:uncharacterized membrane protein